MLYYDVLEALSKNKIKYLVVGGLAVILHGAERFTHDIDVMILMNEENILNFNNVLKKLGYLPRVPVNPDDLVNKDKVKKWIKEKNMKVFSFFNKHDTLKVIDLLINHPLDFEKSYKERVVKKVKDVEINILSIDDLIQMKKLAGRDKDKFDILELKKVKKVKEKYND